MREREQRGRVEKKGARKTEIERINDREIDREIE